MKIQQFNKNDKVRSMTDLVSLKGDEFPRGTHFKVREVSLPETSKLVPSKDGKGMHRFHGFISLVEILPNFDPMKDKLRTLTIDNYPEQMDHPLIVITA